MWRLALSHCGMLQIRNTKGSWAASRDTAPGGVPSVSSPVLKSSVSKEHPIFYWPEKLSHWATQSIWGMEKTKAAGSKRIQHLLGIETAAVWITPVFSGSIRQQTHPKQLLALGHGGTCTDPVAVRTACFLLRYFSFPQIINEVFLHPALPYYTFLSERTWVSQTDCTANLDLHFNPPFTCGEGRKGDVTSCLLESTGQ